VGAAVAVLAAAMMVAGAAPVDRRGRERGDIESEVLREQNLARTDPHRYADYVEAWLPYYHGKTRLLPGEPSIRTIEGKEGVRDAVEFLRAQTPLPPLKPSQGLALAARDHVEDAGRKGWMGHIGSDDSEPADRVSRYGKWYRRVGENITYGGSVARELVIRLIIDDGIPDRGHRANIFNPEFTLTGAAFGLHADYGTMCVITYAADYEEY